MPDRPQPEAFARMYDEQVWRVYGFFGYRLSSRADAEDLTQLTFERALRSWRRFDSTRGTIETWLLAIARNLLIDHFRRSHLRSHASLDDEATAARIPRPVAHPLDLGLSADLADALSMLSDRERELIALRFGGEMTGPEIAELTGLSLSNVQQILSRSLRRLRAELRPRAEL